jgi:hypothetical protein
VNLPGNSNTGCLPVPIGTWKLIFLTCMPSTVEALTPARLPSLMSPPVSESGATSEPVSPSVFTFEPLTALGARSTVLT